MGLAYLSAYLRKHGYEPVMIDAMGEKLNQVWSPEDFPGFLCQGLRFEEIIERIPKAMSVIGMVSPLQPSDSQILVI